MQTNIETPVISTPKVNWLQVTWFLALAFGLSWLVDLVLYLNGGLSNPATTLLLQLQMLLPAFSALLLGVFFFKESPVYIRTNLRTSRWFCYFYFLLTISYLIGAIIGLLKPEIASTISAYLLIPNAFGLILLIALRWAGGREAFAGAGIGGGKARVWILFGLGLVAFYGLQTLLNYVFKLGTPVNLKTSFPQLMASNLPNAIIYLSTTLNTIVLGPLLGLIIAFGEEYGWRGYLQTQMNSLGRIRGTFLLGIIWGIWHWPIIWMGYNFPGHPYLGSLAMVIVCILLAFFLAYSVFKSKGVWTAAYLHALNNQTLSYIIIFFYKPTDLLFSFTMGFPGLAIAAVILLFLLRDPVWREQG